MGIHVNDMGAHAMDKGARVDDMGSGMARQRILFEVNDVASSTMFASLSSSLTV